MYMKTKKLFYFAALLAVLAGCKKEGPDQSIRVHDLNVSVKIENTDDLNFEAGDGFCAAIAKTSSPATAIKVEDSYHTDFSFENSTLKSSIFNGTFAAIDNVDLENTYCFYGVLPAPAEDYEGYGAKLDNWMVTLPDSQTATQTGWDKAADILLMNPTAISNSDPAANGQALSYSPANGGNVEFDHLFGFGKVSFAGFPVENAGLVVKSVSIEAVGAEQALAGKFPIDITKPAVENVLTTSEAKNVITLAGDGKIAIGEYAALFVANPGSYDLKFTVNTDDAIFTFEASNVTVERGVKPEEAVVAFISDVVYIKPIDVEIAQGETWSFTPSEASCIVRTYPYRFWGDSDKKMLFSFSYPESTVANWGTGMAVGEKYAQAWSNGQKIDGGQVVLASNGSFKGVNFVKVNFGLSNGQAVGTATLEASLVNGENKTVLGTANVSPMDISLSEPQDYYFNAPSFEQAGKLVFTLTIPEGYKLREAVPFLTSLEINPTPVITLSSSLIDVEKAGASNTLDCVVNAAKTVNVTTSDSWITASYADGKLSYSIAENTGNKRNGTITITATGVSTQTKSIEVKQRGEAERFVLTITANDLHDAINSKINAGFVAEAGKYYELVHTFKAKSVNNPENTKDVEIKIDQVLYNSTYTADTDDMIRLNLGDFKCTSAIGDIEQIFLHSYHRIDRIDTYAPALFKYSNDGVEWGITPKAQLGYSSSTNSTYTNTVKYSDVKYKWFNLNINSGSWFRFIKIEVTFLVD